MDSRGSMLHYGIRSAYMLRHKQTSDAIATQESCKIGQNIHLTHLVITSEHLPTSPP